MFKGVVPLDSGGEITGRGEDSQTWNWRGSGAVVGGLWVVFPQLEAVKRQSKGVNAVDPTWVAWLGEPQLTMLWLAHTWTRWFYPIMWRKKLCPGCQRASRITMSPYYVFLSFFYCIFFLIFTHLFYSSTSKSGEVKLLITENLKKKMKSGEK